MVNLFLIAILIGVISLSVTCCLLLKSIVTRSFRKFIIPMCIWFSITIISIAFVLNFTDFYNEGSKYSKIDFVILLLIFVVIFVVTFFSTKSLVVSLILLILFSTISTLYIQNKYLLSGEEIDVSISSKFVLVKQGTREYKKEFSSESYGRMIQLCYTKKMIKIPVLIPLDYCYSLTEIKDLSFTDTEEYSSLETPSDFESFILYDSNDMKKIIDLPVAVFPPYEYKIILSKNDKFEYSIKSLL